MPQRNDDLEGLARAVMTLIETGHRRISAVLDLTRVQVLAAVADAGALRPAQISAQLGLNKSTVSRHLTALQEAGQISITDDPADARTFLVAVTPSGRADTEATGAAGAAQFAAAITDWSDAEVAQGRQVVERLLDAWDQPDAPDRVPAPPVVNTARWKRMRLTDRANGQTSSQGKDSNV